MIPLHACIKVIHPKYSKHWPYTVVYTIDCVCSKVLIHGLPKTEVWWLFSKFFTSNFLFWEHLGFVCFRSDFVGKKPSYIFSWTTSSQCQNSANNLTENTPNASKNFSPIWLPKPKSFKFLKKKNSRWVSVVRGLRNS